MEGGCPQGGGSLASSYKPGNISIPDHRTRSGGPHMAGIKFPATKSILWDHRNTGPSVFLHPAQYRNPELILDEKTLRLAHRFAQDTAASTYTCALTGSVTADTDGEWLSITIDQFEPNTSNAQIPDQLHVPCQVEKNSSKPKSSVQDYVSAIERVGERCSSKCRIDLCGFLGTHAYCSYHANRDSFIFHMDFDVVMPSTTLKVTPVKSVPVVPTALAKNLAGPLSVSELQGEAKSGYLSMDQTRKLLLVLESDPKVSKLPMVGVWVSGVSSVKDPFVWASCLRYLYSSSLQERVCTGVEPFLVLLYLSTYSRPQFYECIPSDGRVKLDLALYTCHEVLQLPRLCLERAQSPIELEMTTVESGPKQELLQAALHKCRSWLETVGKKPELSLHLSGSLEDMMPRSSPAPHRAKASLFKPAVPEISLLWDENSVCEPTTSAKPSQRARPPLKPVNRPSAMPPEVPASPAVITEATLAKCTMHRSPHAPVVHQGQWTKHPAEAVPVRGPPSQPAQLPLKGGALPMAQGHIYPARPVSHPPFRQQSPYQPYPYGPHYPFQQQGYSRPLGAPAPYGCPLSAAPACPGYSPQAAPVRPAESVYGPGPRQGSPGANLGQSSHLPMQDTMRPLAAGQPPTQNSAIGCMASSPCLCSPNSAHVKHSRTVKPAAEHTGSSADSAQTTGGAFPVAHLSNVVLAEQPAVPHLVPVLAQSGHMQSTCKGTSPDDVSSVVDSSLQTTQSTQSYTPDSSEASPDVYALLQMQDKELKLLREQLSQLLARQSAEETRLPQPLSTGKTQESATQSSGTATPRTSLTPSKETCSIAINTSLWWPNSATPQQQLPPHLGESATCFGSALPQRQSKEDLAKPGLPSRHRLNEEEGMAYSNETLSVVGDLQLPHQLDGTEESMVSEMIVDMTDYTSLSPDKSGQRSSSGYGDTDDSYRSPQLGESVSMYQQAVTADPSQQSSGDDTGLGESQPNASLVFKYQDKFYENLRGNVQLMLGQSGESLPDSSRTETDSDELLPSLPQPGREQSEGAFSVPHLGSQQLSPLVAVQTKQQLLKMGINVDSLSADKSYRLDQTVFFDSAMLPKINYVSMMLDHDPDISADADALSMKYLSDEQLSELAKLRLQSHRKSQENSGLHRVVNSMQRSTPEEMTYGLPANHMSFATKKYMERYGLAKDISGNVTVPEVETDPGDVNVHDFLKAVADRSVEMSQQSQAMDDPSLVAAAASPRVAGNCISCDNSIQGVPLNYHSDGESFHIQGKPSSTPADRKPSFVSDTTPNRTPQKTSLRRPRPLAQTYAPGSDTTPLRPQNMNSPKGTPYTQDVDMKMQDMFAVYPGAGGDPPRQVCNKSPPKQQKAVGMVLDIERLKELPKLL